MTGKHERAKASTGSKWSSRFLADLFERVASVFIYSAITFFTTNSIVDIRGESINKLWPVLFLPALLSLLKGLAANMISPTSGASMIPAPPGPDVVD